MDKQREQELINIVNELKKTTVPKNELISRTAKQVDYYADDVKIIIEKFLEELEKSLGEFHTVLLSSYFTLEPTVRKGREMVSVVTGDKVECNPSVVVNIKLAKNLKDQLDYDLLNLK